MSVCRPECFFFHYPGEKLLGNTHVTTLVHVSDPHQGKLLPRHSTGDLQRAERSFAVCGVVGPVSVSLFA